MRFLLLGVAVSVRVQSGTNMKNRESWEKAAYEKLNSRLLRTGCVAPQPFSAPGQPASPIGVRLPLLDLTVDPVCPRGAVRLGDDLVTQTHGERFAGLNPRPHFKGRRIDNVLPHDRIA